MRARTNFLDLLARTDRPTAIFACNDLHALGVYQAARRMGLRIPGLSVVGFDDLPLATLVDPPLTHRPPAARRDGRHRHRVSARSGAGERSPQLGLELATALTVRGSTTPAAA